MTEPTPVSEKKKNKTDKVLVALAAVLIGMLAITYSFSGDHKQAEPAASDSNDQTVKTTAETAEAATLAENSPEIQATGKTLGLPSAPIKMVEFSSLTCGHCAHFHNQTLEKFRKKYIDTGKVVLEFREFPLNKPAFDATLLANCLPPEQYFGFISMLFQTQEHWAFATDYLTPLKQNAKLAGMSEDSIVACLGDEKGRERLTQEVESNVKKYNLQSTPTFILNEGAQTIVGAQPLDGFSALIDPMLGAPAQSDTPNIPTEGSPEP